MIPRLLMALMILAAACGENEPGTDGVFGNWRLTGANLQPLPAMGNATGGETWAAAVLQLNGSTGIFDRCFRNQATLTKTSLPTTVIVTRISEDSFTVSYDDRDESVPDTATISNDQLTLRYRDTVEGQAGLDELSFVRLDGAVPEACSLAP